MFYTYIHRKQDNNEIFYVGKGKAAKKRAFDHRNRNKHWTNIVKKHGLKVEIVACWQQEKQALDHEIFLIDVLKDLGHPLVNLTLGGDGITGYLHTDEFRKWQSERVKKEYQNSIQKEKRRLSQVKRFNSEQVRKEHGKKVRERWTEEARKLAAIRIKKNHKKNGHPRQKVTTEIVKKMIELRGKGLQLAEIGKLLNLHKYTVGEYLRGDKVVA